MPSDVQPPPPAPGAPAAEPSAMKKTLWETILTATPILLTILATLLAGQSSGQMTKAQYHRAVAAQNESKAGSQWAFFQAKRQRGTMLSMAILTLRANFGEVPTGPEDLLDFAGRLVAALLEASGQARSLTSAGEGDAAGKKRAEKLAGRLDKQLQRARGLQKQMAAELKKAEKEKAFSYLNARELPDEEPNKNPILIVLNEAEKASPAIPQANDVVVRKRKAVEEGGKKKLVEFESKQEWEKEVQRTLKPISDAQLVEAIDLADKRAKRFEDLSGPKETVYRNLEGLLKQQLVLCGELDREAREFLRAGVGGADKSPRRRAAAAPPISAPANEARSLVQRADDLNRLAKQIVNSFTIAQLDYNFRRYEREARYNQGTAILYELRVRKSALVSDGHIKSSEMFFYGMLAAQAGVTIATFALAVRQKSALWALASTAGVGALGIGGYVYLTQLM